MKLLLDTHTFIWFYENPDRLSQPALDALTTPGNVWLLSVVSIWEMQIKVALGKLGLSHPLVDVVNRAVDDGMAVLPMEAKHVLELDALPDIHKDPFDRALIAQARCEGLTIVTQDQLFSKYPVNTLW